jgi:GMC oxidoreductase
MRKRVESSSKAIVRATWGITVAAGFTSHAGGEAILAAGAINSPQLLQLSGVGDPVLRARQGRTGRGRGLARVDPGVAQLGPDRFLRRPADPAKLFCRAPGLRDLAPRARLRDRKISQACVTANEMREGPSKPACRRRLQTASSCCGTMAAVVSVEEKAGRDSVRYGPRR